LYSAVLFDCDGVLVDSEILSTRALQMSMQSLGLDYSLDEVAATFTGHSWQDCLKVVEGLYGAPLPNLEQFRADNRAYCDRLMASELRSMPGIERVLEGLRLPFALVTNSGTQELNLKLSVTGLDRYFPGSHRFDAERMAVAKPNPAIYQRAAAQMGVAIGDCLVIEDSLPGLTAASRAGACVWAYRPHPEARQLRELEVERVLDSWEDFPRDLI